MTDIEHIENLISEKDFNGAKQELLKLEEKDRSIDTFKLLGLCYVNLGEYEEGKKIFETVVKYNDDATSWFYLANCYDNLNELIHAISAYEEVLRMHTKIWQ